MLEKSSQWELQSKENMTKINNLKKDLGACRQFMNDEVDEVVSYVTL